MWISDLICKEFLCRHIVIWVSLRMMNLLITAHVVSEQYHNKLFLLNSINNQLDSNRHGISTSNLIALRFFAPISITNRTLEFFEFLRYETKRIRDDQILKKEDRLKIRKHALHETKKFLKNICLDKKIID